MHSAVVQIRGGIGQLALGWASPEGDSLATWARQTEGAAVNRHPDIVAQATSKALVRICFAIMPVLRGLRVEQFPSIFVAPAYRASHHSGPGESTRP
jgi:hypothetical protein